MSIVQAPIFGRDVGSEHIPPEVKCAVFRATCLLGFFFWLIFSFFYFLKTCLWKTISSNLFENQFKLFTTGNTPRCKYVLFKSQMYQTKQYWINTRRMTDNVGTRRNKWTPWGIRIHFLLGSTARVAVWALWSLINPSSFRTALMSCSTAKRTSADWTCIYIYIYIYIYI